MFTTKNQVKVNVKVGQLEQKIEELLDHSDMTMEELSDLLNEDVDLVTTGTLGDLTTKVHKFDLRQLTTNRIN